MDFGKRVLKKVVPLAPAGCSMYRASKMDDSTDSVVGDLVVLQKSALVALKDCYNPF